MSGPVRALSGIELDAFRALRVVAGESMPYFLHALFAVSPVAAPGLGTFAVDAHWRLYMDPDLLIGPARWSPVEGGAALLHEVNHLLRDHAERADALPIPRSHIAFNLAGDAEINDDLIAAGVRLPEGVVTPSALGLPDGLLAEQYYAALRKAAEAHPDLLAGMDDGGPGCGSGAGTSAVAGELPAPQIDGNGPGAGVPDGTGGLSAAAAGMVRRAVAVAVQEYGVSKGRGTLPAGLERWAASTLAPSTVAWTRLLRAAVRRAVSAAASRTDYTYLRPSRRRVAGVVLPAMRGRQVRVTIVVDTSASMGAEDLAAAMGEVGGVLRAGQVSRDRVRLLSCDAETGVPQKVASVAAIKLVGGGGTDMRVGIDAAMADRPAPDVVVVLTDGYTPWPGQPIDARLICAVITDGSAQCPQTPSWATTVTIPRLPGRDAA
ncbi:VWA-like domain-containing protein [Kribbella sp. NPDC059898]|uniref:vWA domain-containing protein n=1 Tax=Kribbella sp. NPDC059898 TaxID=3346995 RepID=UPI003664A01B